VIRRVMLLAVSLLSLALGADEKPIPCTLMVSPLRGESNVTKSGGNTLRGLTSGTSYGNTGTKTVERTLKWKAELRFREGKPAKVELKAYHIGYGDGGKTMTILGNEAKTVELDKNGRASVEFESPKARLTKTRTRTSTGNGSSRSSGFVSTKTRVSGERVSGCVVQLFGDGKLLKSWSSDSRWVVAADKVPFSVEELKAKSGKIGLR